MSDIVHTNTCVCGRTFTDPGGFTRHEKSCRKGKKRLSGVLAKAKEVYQVKKARISLSRSTSANDNAIASGSDRMELDPRGDASQQVCFTEYFLVISKMFYRTSPHLYVRISNLW